LRNEATQMVEEYRQELLGQISTMSERFAFHPIPVEPHIFVKPTDDGGTRIWVRIALPARSIAVGADRLHRSFLAWSGGVTEV